MLNTKYVPVTVEGVRRYEDEWGSLFSLEIYSLGRDSDKETELQHEDGAYKI